MVFLDNSLRAGVRGKYQLTYHHRGQPAEHLPQAHRVVHRVGAVEREDAVWALYTERLRHRGFSLGHG